MELTCSSIGNYIEDLLDLGFFTCGNTILRQCAGIPMGNHVSPPLVICTCMFFEDRFMRSFRDVHRPIGGLRYMDDLLHFTLCRNLPNHLQQRELFEVSNALELARGIYPDTMRVIVTGEYPPLPFLETSISWRGDQIFLQYDNKNGGQRGVQEIRRFRHGKSLASTSSLLSVVLCMLKRVTQFNNCLGTQLLAILQLLQEFSKLKYSDTIIRRALHRLIRTDIVQRKLWELSLLLWGIPSLL